MPADRAAGDQQVLDDVGAAERLGHGLTALCEELPRLDPFLAPEQTTSRPHQPLRGRGRGDRLGGEPEGAARGGLLVLVQLDPQAAVSAAAVSAGTC
ncbi:hypothetical protein GCM10009714_01760 [Microlunatus capsulatus]